LFKRESLGAIYGLDHASPARILVSTQLAQCFSDPTLAVASDSTAIAHDQSAALSLSAMTSQYFIGGMMPESANPVQEHQTIIEIDRIEAPSSFQVVRK
jgi:hypothetical protein